MPPFFLAISLVINLALSWEGCVVLETGEQQYYRQLGGMKKS